MKIRPLMVIPRRDSELKAVEEVCREASRTVEPWNGWNVWNQLLEFNDLNPSTVLSGTAGTSGTLERVPVERLEQMF